MTVYESLSLTINAGLFLIAVLTFIVTLIVILTKKK